MDANAPARCPVSGKLSYATKADIEATRTNARSRVYRCPCCGMLHWSLSPKPIAVRPPRHRRPAAHRP